jgi:hypothetical protein
LSVAAGSTLAARQAAGIVAATAAPSRKPVTSAIVAPSVG